MIRPIFLCLRPNLVCKIHKIGVLRWVSGSNEKVWPKHQSCWIWCLFCQFAQFDPICYISTRLSIDYNMSSRFERHWGSNSTGDRTPLGIELGTFRSKAQRLNHSTTDSYLKCSFHLFSFIIYFIQDMLLVAAMGPPGGGRTVISKRLQSRFNLINMTFPQVKKK